MYYFISRCYKFSVRLLTRIYFLAFISIALPPPAFAESCRSIRSFEAAHAKEHKEKEMVIQPFDGPKDVALVVTVLMKEYLGLSKDVAPLTVGKSDASRSKKGSPYVMSGTVLRDGAGYVLSVAVDNASQGNGASPIQAAGKFLYPDGLNDALVGAIDQITKSMKSPLPPKKLLPFLNTTTSSNAYAFYAQAQEALDTPVWSQVRLGKVQEGLERAIEADYNYVPAYLSLSEVLAARSRLTGDAGMKNKSLVELAKAKLLLPPLADRRETEAKIRWYLEAKDAAVCGDLL